MWSFGSKKRDAFKARARQQEVWRFLRRVIDSHAPNAVLHENSSRAWDRSNRCVAAACVPVVGDEIRDDLMFFAPTKDLSDSGLSLITNQELDFDQCICGFWLDELKLLQGTVRRTRPLGGGMYEVGIEIAEIIDSEEVHHELREAMRPLMAHGEAVQTH